MKDRQRDDPWNPLFTLAIVAGVGLLLWAAVRKRGAPMVPLSAIAPPPPLVSLWSPLP